MKSAYIYILPLLFILLLSCEKAPINGQLDGQWEVVDVYPVPEQIVIKERLFYNFSLHVCMLSYYGGTLAFSNLDYHGEEIKLNFIEEAPDGDLNALPQYGIVENPIIFTVNFQDSHHLTLTSDVSKVVLIKH